MTSRMSRGVPEWSGGKDLYMGSPVLVIGKVSGAIGNVPGPPGGSRGSTKWGHMLQRHTWAKYERAPAPRWARAPPTMAHAPRRGEGANPKGRWALRPILPAPPSPPPLWPPPIDGFGAATPLGVGTLEGAHPPPSPLYIVEVFGATHRTSLDLSMAQPCISPSSSPAVLGEALQDCHAPPPPPCHCAAAGRSLPQPLPLSLLDQGMGDVTKLYVC